MLATIALTVVVLAIATVAAAPGASADDSEAQALKQVQRELRQLRADRARDRKLIEKLEQKLVKAIVASNPAPAFVEAMRTPSCDTAVTRAAPWPGAATSVPDALTFDRTRECNK